MACTDDRRVVQFLVDTLELWRVEATVEAAGAPCVAVVQVDKRAIAWIERAAVMRDATALEVKDSATSGVGSENGWVPPALTVRARKVWDDAPAGASSFSAGLKLGSPAKLNVPGGPLSA